MRGFEPINLDGFTDDAEELRELGDTLWVLGAYARVKAAAMEFRKKGRISRAEQIEQELEGEYAKLPDWAKW